MKLKISKPKVEKADLKKLGVDLLFIVIGCSISSFSTIGILLPNGLTSGGITGMVRIVQQILPLDFSTLYYGFAITILIICGILLGLKEARKIMLMTIVYPSILFVFEHFHFSLLEEKDLFLAAIYCGVLGGICSGLVFSRGYSFGGTDTIAKIIQKRMMPHVGLSQILMVIDAVQLEIITSKHDIVADYILNDISRGVTNVEVTGAYTQTPRKKIVTICSPRESMLIRKFVAKKDKNAFVTVVHVDSVWGNGEGFNDLLKD